jgi:hypothetical protein
MRNRTICTALLLVVGIAIPAGWTQADDISNNLDATIDAVAESMALVFPGPTATTGLYVTPRNGDGKNGCNLTGGTALEVTVNSSATGVATVSPPSVTFTSCGDVKPLTVTPVGAGTTTITVTQISNNTGGTFDFAPATFIVNVTAADTTPPVITKVVTGTLGSNGWYTTNPTVTWTVTDPQSTPVIDSGCAVQTFTNESAGAVSTCTAHSAGGSAADSVTLKIDKSGPSAVLNATGTAGTNGWFTSDVAVSTTGSDTISGPVSCSPLVTLTAETSGANQTGSCTNQAGLSTAAEPINVKIDKTGPSASLAVTAGTAGTNGWYTSDVTVTASGSDSISNPVTCSPEVPITGETGGTTVTGSCTNDAGLSTDAENLVVRLDQSNPTAALSLAGTLGSNGWYISDVEATTTGADTVSEPVTCTGTQHFSTDTAGVTINGSCTNHAGLEQAADSVDLKIDQTAPTDVALTVTGGTPGANGWYTSDVTVATTGTDSTSGVTCTADQTVTAEGTTELTGECTNGAGLTTHATNLTIKLDKSGPSATLAVTAGTLGTNGWYTTDVTVTTSGSDSISGPVTCTTDQQLTNETTGQDVNGTCTNAAGLTTQANQLTVKIDKTGPTAALAVTAGTLGANGWYTTDLTITTTGTDTISGPPTCTEPVYVSANTTGTDVNGSCTNAAGFTTNATSLTVKLDKTPPTVTMVGGPAHQASYYFGTVPSAPTCSGSDTTSGLASCIVAGYSAAVGDQTVTVVATDNAGNSSSESHTYTVLGWTINGFYQPVDMSGIWNTVKNGSTAPLKFEVFAGAIELTNTSIVNGFTVKGVACPTGLVADDIELTTTGGTNLRYDVTGGQFIQNWQTPKGKAGSCYLVTMTTQDGGSISANFQLK